MENRSHALIAGLFTLLLGVAAVASVWWFGGKQDETSTFEVQTHRNVTGLSPQAQVRYRGISVGKVESIELDRDDPRNTLIRISVRKDIPITRGTTAKLGYQGVTGIAHVLLEENGGDGLPLGTSGDRPARIVMQDSLIEELTDVGGDTLRNARDLLASVNEILTPENRQAISHTLVNLEATSRNTRETTAQLKQLLSPENVQRLNTTLSHAEYTVAQAGPFFAEARGLVARLQSTTEKVELALGDSSAAGASSLVPRLNALSDELSASSQQLNRVLQMVEESPQSLIFGRQNPPGPGEAGFVAPAGAGQ
ncbi:MlaD family protein [Propionivibrio limicola]|uniref:MlaD family protein n=1 Tax=Propionivibrio limicola TaxID=167645 RepID=UPI00129246F5|nr:MlaD family protein [Propionivibrio limicola]